jgi:hypothetical protein
MLLSYVKAELIAGFVNPSEKFCVLEAAAQNEFKYFLNRITILCERCCGDGVKMTTVLWMWTIADELTLDRPTTLLLRSSASVYS